MIHSVAGSVSLVALHIAKHYGAQIFATTDSERKRDYLLSLGVHTVADSHNKQFAATLLTASDGQRMGMILNSLIGRLLDASLALLIPLGRFLELGSKNTMEGRALPIRFLAQGGTFIPISFHAAHGAFSRYLQQIVAWIDGNTLPLLPCKSVPLPEVARAFTTLITPQHIGKVVATHRTAAGMDRLNAMIAERHLDGYALSMNNAEVIRQLWPILSARSPWAQLLLSPRAIDGLARGNRVDRGVPSATNNTVTQQTVKKRPHPEIGVPHNPATREVERVLCQILEGYLGLDRVDIDDNCAESGTTSLDIVQLSGQMACHYPQVGVVSLYNHATVHQLMMFHQSPKGESNAPSPQPAVQANARANQIAERALQIVKNIAHNHTSLH